MNIYEAVKESVTTRRAAELYGLEVNRNGMCRCPFHNDKSPSMKVDSRYHCFGCGADGDVINFTAKFFNMSNYEAAKKLAEDFSVTGYERWHNPTDAEVLKRQSILHKRRMQEEKEKDFYKLYTDYHFILQAEKQKFEPRGPDEMIDDRYVHAINELPFVEYVLDSYLELRTSDEKNSMIDFYENFSKKIRKEIGSGKYNYLKNAEEYLEENYDMIDGMINNGVKDSVIEKIDRFKANILHGETSDINKGKSGISKTGRKELR